MYTNGRKGAARARDVPGERRMQAASHPARAGYSARLIFR